jgi:hypothetical protein
MGRLLLLLANSYRGRKHSSLLQQNVIYRAKSFVKFASVFVFTILPIILIQEGNFEDLGAYSQQL